MRRSLWGWDVPNRRLLAALAILPALALGSPTGSWPAPAVDPSLVVDPNTAPPEVLLALPRLGPVLVGRIVDARRREPFRSLHDLDARVRGVGPATAAALRPYLRFDPEGRPGAVPSLPSGSPGATPAP